jgi:hypothetical protein
MLTYFKARKPHDVADLGNANFERRDAASAELLELRGGR